MSHKIQLLINHYQESQALLCRLLDSIERQSFKDYGVLICHDGEEGEAPEKQYPFELEYFSCPHRGICQTRNSLLERASAEYVMFCDADDCFSSDTGLQALMEHDADVIASPYHVERSNGTVSLYKRDTIRVHGKAFRREYLERERIGFPDVLSNGDMYFLWLAFHLTRDIVWTAENFYTWKYNPLSLTRSIPQYGARRYDRALKCYSALARNLMERGRYDFARQVVTENIDAAYRIVHSRSWTHIPKEYTDKAFAVILAFVQEFGEMYMQNSKNHKITDWIAELKIQNL